MRRAVLALLVLAATASTAFAQTKRGTWEGFVYAGNNQQPLVIVLDSAASGWVGSAVGPQGDSLRLVQVTVRADTVGFGVPYNGVTYYIVGLVADGKFNGGLRANDTNAGTVELTRKPEAAKPAKP